MPDFFKVYDVFLKGCGDKNAWAEATFEKMEAMRQDMPTFKKDVKFSDLTEAPPPTEFVTYMCDTKTGANEWQEWKEVSELLYLTYVKTESRSTFCPPDAHAGLKS